MAKAMCSVHRYKILEGELEPCGKPAKWQHIERPDVYCCAKHEKSVMKLIWDYNWRIIKEYQDGKG